MKKILLFVGLVAITMVSCTSVAKDETVSTGDSTAVVGNVDTTAVVKLDSCAVDTCKK